MRRDLMADGGVAPVASTAQTAAASRHMLGGMEEQVCGAGAKGVYQGSSPSLGLRAHERLSVVCGTTCVMEKESIGGYGGDRWELERGQRHLSSGGLCPPTHLTVIHILNVNDKQL